LQNAGIPYLGVGVSILSQNLSLLRRYSVFKVLKFCEPACKMMIA